MPASSSPPPSWDAIAEVFGERLVADAKRVVAANARPKEARSFETAFRQCLGWIASARTVGQPTDTLVTSMSGRGEPGLSDAQYVQLVVGVMNLWIGHIQKARIFKAKTVEGYGSRAAKVFEWLGNLGDARYPPFQSRLVPMQSTPGDVPSLGRAGWLELDGLKGAARERRALGLARADAVRQFRSHEAVFLFGQSVLRAEAPPPGVEPSAWWSLKALLEAERRSWRETGHSMFSPTGAAATVERPPYHGLLFPQGWLDAGFPPTVTVPNGRWPGRLQPQTVWALLCACLGATRQATVSVMTVFCCDTGWNKQTIFDLPRHPFVFQTREERGIATAAFVSSFKNRAGHDVLAYLDRGVPVGGLLQEQVLAGWRSAANDFDPGGTEDGYTILDAQTRQGDDSLLSILERYQPMAEAIRDFDRRGTFADRFFIYTTARSGINGDDPITATDAATVDVPVRKGVSFQAVRKSFLSLKVREVGSVAALRPVAGHSRTNILMPHYLNSDDIKAELDESIRFFQNACQALIVGGNVVAGVRLDLEPTDLEWFHRLATVGGIAAAAGLMAEDTSEARPSTLRFIPTDDNLRDLFLTHLALRRCRRRITPARWKVQALPLLGAVKAIGRALFAKGLGRAYVAAARRAYADFRAGTIVLPPVVEA